MQYYISLPQGWTALRRWPVVVVIESANRQFEETLSIFEKARKDLPFILLTPLVTTNGGANYRQAGTYRYTDAVWNQIEQDRCRFDSDGITAVVSDARSVFGGEDRYFLTGWEAGGDGFSTAPSRVNLPVMVFQVTSGRDVAPGRFVYLQSQQARKIAAEHGWGNVSERIIADKPHGPLADEVLAFFASIMDEPSQVPPAPKARPAK